MNKFFNCPVNEGQMLEIEQDDDCLLIKILTPWNRGRSEYVVTLVGDELGRFKSLIAADYITELEEKLDRANYVLEEVYKSGVNLQENEELVHNYLARDQ